MRRIVHYAIVVAAIFSLQIFPQNKYQIDPRGEILELIPPHERDEILGNMENIDNPNDYYRYKETYYDEWNGALWADNERTLYTYNEEEGNEQLTQLWNGSSWVNSSKYTYVNDNNTYLYVYQYWNGTEWLNNYRYIYNYESGYISNYIYQEGDSLTWVNDSRYIYYRNSQTHLEDSILYQEWNGSSWENSQLSVYNKAANGKDSIVTYCQWSSGWKQFYRYLYTYDDDTPSYEYIAQTWDDGTNNWVNVSRSSYNYSSNYQYLGYLYQTWDGFIWVNNSRVILTYDGNNRLIEQKQQVWDGTLWENYRRNTYEYNPDGYRSLEVIQEYVMGDWENKYKGLYSYDENGNLTELIGQNWDGAIFVNTSRNRYIYELVTSVENEQIVNSFQLYNNYPNPFNPSTKIDFNLPQKSYVILKVYDILGNEVKTLINGELESGFKSVSFNASGLASGVYLYKIDVKSTEGKQIFSEARKMLLMK